VLDLLDNIVRGEFRVVRDEQVYVVGLDCQSEDVEIEFVSFLFDGLFEAVGNLIRQYRLAVLRTSHEVVVEAVNRRLLLTVPPWHTARCVLLSRIFFTLGRPSRMDCVIWGRIHPTTEVVGFLLTSL
jgi:hypothetical protein